MTLRIFFNFLRLPDFIISLLRLFVTLSAIFKCLQCFDCNFLFKNKIPLIKLIIYFINNNFLFKNNQNNSIRSHSGTGSWRATELEKFFIGRSEMKWMKIAMNDWLIHFNFGLGAGESSPTRGDALTRQPKRYTEAKHKPKLPTPAPGATDALKRSLVTEVTATGVFQFSHSSHRWFVI
jgi:hypothetical protein